MKMPVKKGLCHLLLLASVATPCLGGQETAIVRDDSAMVEERQLTYGPYGHMLTNASIWSPDSRWIVYDTRCADDRFDGTRIEQVNVETRKVELLYQSRNGAACGVVTYHPAQRKVVFILGPDASDKHWTYGASRRRGIVVNVEKSRHGVALDAMNYAPPFMPGALRGGSHVHVFSGNGKRVSFTYDDELLRELDSTKIPHDPNQRNIGVAMPLPSPLRVNTNNPHNNDGTYFSAVVTRTVAIPRPGSDDIVRACEESWIGSNGYRRKNGTWQKYALAFQGTVCAKDGTLHREVFAVDIPEDMTQAGDDPLEGTQTRRPAPPRGTRQRRLTHTDTKKYPGIQGCRHWLKSSPDGASIAFLMKDDAGVVQIWTVSPNGGKLQQRTRNPWNVSSAFSWSPNGKWIAYVMDGSIFITETGNAKSHRLTAKAPEGSAPLPFACVISPNGKQIAYARHSSNGYDQIYTVAIPASTLPFPPICP